MNKETMIAFRIEKNIKEKLELLAAKNHRSVSNFLQMLIDEALAK